jgi:ZIP family zinc transporter
LDPLLLALAYGAFAGLMIPVGGYLARAERVQPNWLEEEVRHSVIAFGGGVLVAAVALVLVPSGMEQLSPVPALVAFFAGGVIFALFERARQEHADVNAQFLAMLTDFLPESISLGALLATGAPEAGLLALLIGAQNLPEAFNAWRELQADGRHGAAHIMRLFFAIASLGPLAVLLGYYVLADLPALTGGIMMGAAGGILYLMFQDIAVEAHLSNRQAPSLAALAGFALGILGHAFV